LISQIHKISDIALTRVETDFDTLFIEFTEEYMIKQLPFWNK
jgi:hypothetical protein